MFYKQKELERGIKHEKEHTGDTALATKISVDHLLDDPTYYSTLEKAGLEKEGAMTPMERGMGEASRLSSSGLGKGGESKPLKSSDLAECGIDAISITLGDMAGVRGSNANKNLQGNVGGSQAPLTTSELGNKMFGEAKPLKSDNLGSQAPRGDNSIGQLGKTPPKMGGKDSAMGDMNVQGMKIQDEEGNDKPNNVEYGRTPPINGHSNSNSNATEFFAGQISKALRSETPRRMEMIPANVSEGGAHLKKKVNDFGGVKVDDAHAGLTTDMKNEDRWTIQAFDTKAINKKETPPINESHPRHSQMELRNLALILAHFLRTASPAEIAEFVEAEKSGDLRKSTQILSKVLAHQHGRIHKHDTTQPMSFPEEPLTETRIKQVPGKYQLLLGVDRIHKIISICMNCENKDKIPTQKITKKGWKVSRGMCDEHVKDFIQGFERGRNSSTNAAGAINLKELIFQTDTGQNNAGVMEVFEFFEKATNEEKTEFDNLINSGQDQAAWNLVEKVLSVQFKGEGPWRPDPHSEQPSEEPSNS